MFPMQSLMDEPTFLRSIIARGRPFASKTDLGGLLPVDILKKNCGVRNVTIAFSQSGPKNRVPGGSPSQYLPALGTLTKKVSSII